MEEELAQFNDLFKVLLGTHEEYNAQLEDEERAIDDDWFNDLDNRVCAFKRKTLNWVNSAREEQQSFRHSSRSSRIQSSIHTRRSSESKFSKSSQEKEVEDRVKMAELLAEVQYVEQRQQIENQVEMLKIKEEIAKTKARVEAYSWKEAVYEKATDRRILASSLKTSDEKEKQCLSEKQINHYNTKSVKNLSDTCMYDAEAPPMRKDSSKSMKVNTRSEIKDERRKDKEESTDTNVAEMLWKMMKQQPATEIDLDVFDGNPLNFHYFMALFREAVEKKIEDPCGRLTRLIKYTTGEVKDLIKNYIQLPAKDRYEAAKNQLYQLYGDPHIVIAAYWKEIKHWPQVKHGDAEGYRRFPNFLLKCETITQMQTWNVLDTPEVMCILLSKLNGGTRDKGSRKVLGIRRKLERDPDLADLIDFVSDENLVVNDPIFSKEAVEQYIEKKPVKCGRKLSTYVSGSTECHVLDHGDKILKCINCAAIHLLDNCPSFLEKTLRERELAS